MNQVKILNNIEHANLHVVTQQRAEFGDNKMCVAVTLSELRNVQNHYPILFYPDATSQKYHPMAIFGFEQNENLFLTSKQWSDTYVPAMMRKGPFSIGTQHTSDGQENFIISIDESDPRVSPSQGEPLFLPHGGASDYTLSIAESLNQLREDQPITDEFTQFLHANALLTPVNIEFESEGFAGIKLTGFYTIDEEKLTALSPQQLAVMAQKGFLHGAYFAIASLSNLATLMKMKQSLGQAYAKN